MALKAFKLCLSVSAPLLASAACPGGAFGTPPRGHAPVANVTTYVAALENLDLTAVVSDVERLLTDSQNCWPADYGNYGPFFIRLAWHCSGTYRVSDGRGGCSGGRQRFAPEKDWADNANLGFARGLLWPVKEKYGDALSWGDLFILAGTASIKSMGGPITQYCAGRVDDPDGTSSYDLGPTAAQEAYAPCEVQGRCKQPLGSTTVGLIYMNPEGPVVETSPGHWAPDPNPAMSAKDVRDTFSRMGFNMRESVALIGGGHAFGKTHGACKLAEGQTICGTGKGKDAFTSGFEGPWTTTPLRWSNEFFRYLKSYEWEKHIGPGGHWQWRTVNGDGPQAKLMRLTTDLALLHDDEMKQYVDEFAADQGALDEAFSKAWFKLTTDGGTWAENKKCVSLETWHLGEGEVAATSEVLVGSGSSVRQFV